VEVQSVRFISF